MKKWLIRLLAILIGLPLLLILTLGVAYLLSNRTNGRLESSGETRRYLLYVPESYDPNTPTPLVISIHGFAEWPAHQMQISGWNDLADQHGFIVVYPMGTGFPLRWRTSDAPGSDGDASLDVTFISELIDQLAEEYNLDPTRIFANGLSNGGGMSFVLACRLSERIAAVGMVSGAYFLPWEACNPARPVPAIVFHGTADKIVPYQGSPSSRHGAPLPAIPGWVATLAQRRGDRCAVHRLRGGCGLLHHPRRRARLARRRAHPGLDRGLHQPGYRCQRSDVGVFPGASRIKGDNQHRVGN